MPRSARGDKAMKKGRLESRPFLVSNFSRTEPALSEAEGSVRATLRFLRRDRVLRGLCHAELYDRLRLGLNWFAGLRVASHAGLAMRLHEAAEAGHNEHTVLLRFFNRRICQVLQKRRDCLVVGFELFSQLSGELSFGHTRCHEFPPSGTYTFACIQRIVTH